MHRVMAGLMATLCLLCFGSSLAFALESKESSTVNRVQMVMTVLEAHVEPANWARLEEIYAEKTRSLPSGLVRTFLVQSQKDTALWRIISIWESQAALDEMRSTGQTPGGVLMFRAAGAEPQLSVYDVSQQSAR